MTRLNAFTDDALGRHDAVGLVQEMAAGRVSSAELVDAAISRTERVDPDLGAVAHRAWDRARAEASNPRGGYFSGVPTFVKDNAEVAGMPTAFGLDAFTPRTATRDGDFARMFRATGVVVLGKTRLSEFGFSASCEHPRQGPVRSPWCTDRTAGASSAGSAVLVASGAVPIAHANDGGGSIRIPAAVNGLVGLKPTRGRVPTDRGNDKAPVRVVADGVLTRSVRDTAAFLRESERIWLERSLPRIGDVTGPAPERLRVALVTRSLHAKVSPATAQATRAVAEFLADQGHHVEEVDPPVPAGFDDDFVLYWSLLAWALTSGGKRDLGPDFDVSKCDGFSRGLAAQAKRHAHQLPGVVWRLRRAAARATAFHQRHDLLLSPVLAHPTPPVGHLDPSQPFEVVMDRLRAWVGFTPVNNIDGTPSMSLPLAADADGLPVGVMLSAGHGREARLLEVAFELEQGGRLRPHLGAP